MFRTGLVLALVVTAGTRAIADEKPKPVANLPADECLFLLYALDDFYRDTWVEPAAGTKAWYSQPVSAFIARRSAAVGDLIQYMRSRNAPTELIDAYGDYLQYLRSGTELAAKLRAREDKHLQFYRDLRQRLLTADQVRQLESNLDVLHAATDAIRGLTEGNGQNLGEGLMSGQAGGLVAARVLTKAMENKVNASRIEELERAKQDAKDFEKQEGPTLMADLAALRSEFLKATATERERRTASGVRAGQKLAELHPDLTRADVAFQTDVDEQTRNPFAVTRALSRLNLPKTIAAGTENLVLARRCFDAVESVPKSAVNSMHNPYRPFRAHFAATAGAAANAVAGLTAGGGFASASKFKAPNPAADLARKAWQAYRKYDPSGRTLADHQEALALAYLGQSEAAYRLVSGAAKAAPEYPDPTFWYDAARIAAAAGKPADVPLAYLKKAVRYGFTDVERVRSDPDLEPIRQRIEPAIEKLFASDE